MKKYLTLFFFALCVCVKMMACTTFAATIDSFEIDSAAEKVDVKGKLDYAGDAAIYTEFYDKETRSYKMDNIAQTVCGEDKSFEFSIPVANVNRFIRITVSGMDYRESNDSIEIYVYTDDMYNNALEMLLSAEKIKELFEKEEYADFRYVLDLNFENFDLLNERQGIYEKLAEKALSYNDLKSSFNEWKEYYNFITAANAIGQASSEDRAYSIYMNNLNELMLRSSKYYNLLATDYFLPGFERTIAGTLRGKSYMTTADFLNEFEEQMIRKLPKYLVYWTDATTVLRLFSEKLNNIDFAGYDGLGAKKDNVDKALAGNEYESSQKLVSAYNSAVASNKIETENAFAPSGSGSGNGGGGGQGIVIPAGDMNPNNAYNSETAGENAPNTPNTIFYDMNDYEWAKEAVDFLAAKGYVSGDGKGRFVPENNITRSEFAKIVCKIFDYSFSGKTNSPFEDVSENGWQYEYVMAAFENGIVNGKSEKTFGADDFISRQEMAVIAFRALEKHGVSLKEMQLSFDDRDAIAEWAKTPVSVMCAMGILLGYENRFSPDECATRAEAACMLYRVMNVFK